MDPKKHLKIMDSVCNDFWFSLLWPDGTLIFCLLKQLWANLKEGINHGINKSEGDRDGVCSLLPLKEIKLDFV